MEFVRQIFSKKYFFILYFPIAVLLAFQNCSDVNFETDSTYVNQLLDSDLILENGQQYTNKKVIAVKIKANPKVYSIMKVSKVMDFTAVPAQPMSNEFEYDLGDDYAADGSKDGVKSLFIELTGSGVPPKVITQNIGLDTVHPSIIPEGILAAGLQGKVYNYQESVNIHWAGKDIVAPTGFSSGLDPIKGIKVGYTQAEDCSSSQVNLVQDWSGYKDSLRVNWPQRQPIDSLYFCIYVKDRAGNLKQVLSQPMTSLWKVVVGENSQGNGGDYLAPNIRFKHPTFLEKDARGNLFISDEHFHNIRVVSSLTSPTPGEVSLFAGNGQPSSVKDGDSIDSGMRYGMNGLVFDEPKNKAFLASLRDGIFLTNFKLNRTRADLKKLINISRPFIAKRVYKGKTTLLIYHMNKFVVNNPEAKSYLYEVPFEDLYSISTVWTVDDLAPYKIAGNGVVSLSSYKMPKTVQLGVDTNVSDNSQTLDRPGAITTDSSGNIYLGSTTDGVGRGWGHHLIRQLKPLESGGFEQTIVGTVPWSNQLEFYNNKLYVSAHHGLKVIDLSTHEESTPIANVVKNHINGVHVDVVNDKPRFYISETYKSRIGVYDSNYNLIYYIGRPVYKENEPNALLAMVGQSDGVVENSDGDLIYVDTISHTIRKVNSQTGVVSTIAGQPGKGVVSEPINQPLSDFTFSGNDATSNSYRKNLVGDFSEGNNILYLGTGASGSIVALDLNKGVANTVFSQSMDSVSEIGFSKRYFRIAGFDYNPVNKSLYASRTYVIAREYAEHATFTGIVTKATINKESVVEPEKIYAGDLYKGREYLASHSNPTRASANEELGVYIMTTMRVTGDQLMYSSGTSGFSAHYLTDNTTKSIVIDGSTKANYSAFEVFNDGDTDYIIYRSHTDLRYFELSRSAVLNPTQEVSVKSKKLCLPGTFLNNSKYFAKGQDNNLIISDTNSGRILKYFISSSSGFQFSECE